MATHLTLICPLDSATTKVTLLKNTTVESAANLTFDDYGVSSDGIRACLTIFYLHAALVSIVLVKHICAKRLQWPQARAMAEVALSDWTLSAVCCMPIVETAFNVQLDMPVALMGALTFLNNVTREWLTSKRLLWHRENVAELQLIHMQQKLHALPLLPSPEQTKRMFFALWCGLLWIGKASGKQQQGCTEQRPQVVRATQLQVVQMCLGTPAHIRRTFFALWQEIQRHRQVPQMQLDLTMQQPGLHQKYFSLWFSQLT